jgi:predicted MFS family arabinose efflux permease
MPIVGYFERKKVDKLKVVFYGAILMAASYFSLLINFWAGMLIISILFITIGEMFAFPFSNSFAMSRAPKGHEGRYMALYTMSFSLAHIVSAKVGLGIIDHEGYQFNWVFMGATGILAALATVYLMRITRAKS